MPTGRLAPLLETQRQRDIPFAIPYFPRWCIYKLQSAACNACSENAKGSLCGCVAQTSFWAEMQKKGTIVSSAFPRSARRGQGTTNGENLNISGRFIEINARRPDVLRQASLCFSGISRHSTPPVSPRSCPHPPSLCTIQPPSF